MLRVSERNTFLVFSPAEGEPKDCASQRSRSVGPCGRSCHNDPKQIVLDRLSKVLSSGQICGSLPQADLKRQETQLVQQAVVEATCLKAVQSNSSVSTMAPEGDDWEEGEEQHVGDYDQDKYGEGKYPNAQPYFQHCRVPRSLNLAEQFHKAKSQAPPTTMMIRNIPNRYTQRELIRELEILGFVGSFDFFYAPIDTGTMGNVGYAFVNFLDYQWAEKCQRLLDGYVFKKHQQKARRKVATVSVAHIQGLQANIRHYENAAVNGSARSKRCGPVIMTSIASVLG